jgi:hypothetical protein
MYWTLISSVVFYHIWLAVISFSFTTMLAASSWTKLAAASHAFYSFRRTRSFSLEANRTIC